MSKLIKRLLKLKQNPKDCRIGELKSIADQLGIDYRQPGTSHVTFRAPSGRKLTVPAHRPLKEVYVKQFIILVEDILDGKND